MQSLTGIATSPSDPTAQEPAQAEPAAAPSSLVARLSRALRRALRRVRPVPTGHANPAPVAARAHTTIMPRPDRQFGGGVVRVPDAPGVDTAALE
ncbi:hypothetical protein ACQCQX_05150, partial [Ralstonia pseudosolanacearum]